MAMCKAWRPWTQWSTALLLAVAIGCLADAVHAANRLSESTVQLVGRARVFGVTVLVDTHEKEWLARHPTLTVGILPNELVPFDIVGLSDEYEGISADYLDAIADLLGVNLSVKTFQSRQDALRALAHRDVDLLATIQGKVNEYDTILSASYFPMRLVEVASPGRVLDRGGEINVGYVPGHVSPDLLRSAFPRARLAAYGSVFLGLTAAAGGRVDVFVDNGTSVAFLIDQYQLITLRPTNFDSGLDSSLHFALRRDDVILQRLVDKALAAIPNRARDDIRARWSSTYESAQGGGRLNLSDGERQWVAAHPVVRYATVKDRIPFMFMNSSGRYNGLSVQVMDLISSKTGLDFRPVVSPADLISNQDHENHADILPVVTRGMNAAPGVVVSDAYFQGYWVVVSRAGEPDILRLEDLSGKRIAYAPPNGVVERIHERVAGVKLIVADSYAATYEMVAAGSADVTIANISTASYYIQQSYNNRLKVAGAIDDAPVDIAFGIRADEPQLLAIINKALRSISPEEMQRVRSNWMFLSHPIGADWRQYSRMFYVLGIGMLVCVALFAAWNRSLQKQVRRRLAAEASLRDQLAFQHAMLEGMPHAVAVRDQQTRLVSCNTAYERIIGVGRSSVINKTLVEAAPPDADLERARLLQARYEQVLSEGRTLSDDADILVNGEWRKVFHWAAPISLKEGGERVALVTGAIDVTERYHLLALVESARAKAEAANRAKSNFLATMSHEIRTPMNAVVGVLELLVRAGHLQPDEREAAELARTSADSLLGLINDILDISKIEAGGLEITPRPAQLRPIVEEVAYVFESLAHQRGLTISVEIDPEIAQWHAVDASRFRQIVSNLVSNAIKYTDSGSVWVRLRHMGETDEVESIMLEVEDTGIGIAPEDVKNLFQPFFQAESAGPRAVGGTGLGLPIVQRLCMKMGGDISVDSQRGRGTCIRVALKLVTLPPPADQAQGASADAAGGTASNPSQRSRFQILVVDDHPANRLLLQRQLSYLGYRSVTAENGKLALDLWIQGGFDLVITDCSMPVMNGYELTTAIRNYEREHRLPHCPVMGCTAHVQEEERRHALDVGMDECVMKPIGIDHLLEVLQRHLDDDDEAPVELLDEGEPSVADVTADPPAFDPQSLKVFSGGDPAIEANFLDAMLRTNVADMQELSRFVHADAFRETAACAHKIKGAARIIKGTEVVQACELVEQVARSADAKALAVAFDALSLKITRFNEAISAHLATYAH